MSNKKKEIEFITPTEWAREIFQQYLDENPDFKETLKQAAKDLVDNREYFQAKWKDKDDKKDSK